MKAIKENSLNDSIKGMREKFIAYYFESVRSHEIDFCVLRGHETLFSDSRKDIDLIMDPAGFRIAVKLFRDTVAEFGGMIIVATGRGKSLYLKAVLLDESESIEAVYIHAVAYALAKTQFWQRHFPGIGKRIWVKDIKSIDVYVDGVSVRIPSPEYRILLLLVRYQQRQRLAYLQACQRILKENKLTESETWSVCGRVIESLIATNDSDESVGDLYRFISGLHKALTRSAAANHIVSWSTVAYFNLMHGWERRGVLIFFSGPDGSGKTTANEVLTRFLTNHLSMCVVNTKHLYPSSMRFGRQSRKLQARLRGIDPEDARRIERDRGNGLGWKFRRLFGLLVLLIQIWPGYIWARYKNFMGYSIVVDTAFFDVFIKGHRPRFPLLETIATPLIPCGDAWYLMKADPAKIVARKPELTVDEIEDYYKRLGEVAARSSCKPIEVLSDKGIDGLLIGMYSALRESKV